MLINLRCWKFRLAFREYFLLCVGEDVFYRMQLSFVEVVKSCALTDLSFSPILFPQPPLCTQVCCLCSTWQDCNSFQMLPSIDIFSIWKGKTHINLYFMIPYCRKDKTSSHAKRLFFRSWLNLVVVPERKKLFKFLGITAE